MSKLELKLVKLWTMSLTLFCKEMIQILRLLTLTDTSKATNYPFLTPKVTKWCWISASKIPKMCKKQTIPSKQFQCWNIQTISIKFYFFLTTLTHSAKLGSFRKSVQYIISYSEKELNQWTRLILSRQICVSFWSNQDLLWELRVLLRDSWREVDLVNLDKSITFKFQGTFSIKSKYKLGKIVQIF